MFEKIKKKSNVYALRFFIKDIAQIEIYCVNYL